MKKILITGWNGMLAYDFVKFFSDEYNIFAFDSKELDIINNKKIEEKIKEIQPKIVLNFAAYTKVDDAEDIWIKQNYDVNALWVYNLAKITNKYNIDFITISTDYVFNWKNENWYNENDEQNPINQYWMAKYLWEKLALEENKNSLIIRTSWLYGWWKDYKNFVNTMLELWKKLDNLKVVNDQFGNPTNCKDLSIAIWKVIDSIWKYRWKIFHFSNNTDWNWITWYEFAKEIFKQSWIKVNIETCNSEEFPTKAKRPKHSKLLNNSDIILRDWREGLKDYLSNIL